MKSMFRRTPWQGKCTCTPASLHLSNTTAMRKGIARSLLGEVREVADMNCVDIIGGDFNMAAFREPRNLGWIEDPCGLVFAHARRRSTRCGGWMADTADCCGLNDRKRDKTWKTYQRGNIQAAHLLVHTQPTARNGARSVDARERRRRNGLVRRQARRARTSDTRRVGLLRAPQCVWRTQSVFRKFLPRTMNISHLSEGRKLHGLRVELNISNTLQCFSMWQRNCTQETFATRSRRGGDEQCSLSLSRKPNAALNLTVCPPRLRLVTCEVEARVSYEQKKCRQTRFETTKPQRNISRTLNGGVEDIGSDEYVLLSALLNILVGFKPTWNLKRPLSF